MPPPAPNGQGPLLAAPRYRPPHPRPPLLLLPLPCGRARRGPSFSPSMPHATEALEKPPATTRSLFSPFSSRPHPSLSSSPTLLHRLHVRLVGSCHQRPLLLSSSCLSATASAASQSDPPICHRCPQLRPPSPSLFRTDTVGLCLHRHQPPELSPRQRTPLS
jgi:hypothetical protein